MARHSGNSPAAFSPVKGLRSHVLPNGLRVFLKEDHRSPVISVQGWVRVGSVDEMAAEAGAAHVLEHMVFKRTRRYSAAEISGWIETLGGSLNAETSREYTHYYIDLPSDGAHKAVEILSELLQHALIDPKDWALECPVILEEIKRRNDDPDVVLWDLLGDALFGSEPLRRPVIGSPETVALMTPESLRAFYRKYYCAQQMAIVVVGDFESKGMLELLKEGFGELAPGNAPARRASIEAPAAARHRRMLKPVQQTYMAFGFPTPPSINPML